MSFVAVQAIDGDKDGADKDPDTGSGNKVVILGVTLSLTIIFAISGVFIGLYFKVERIFCCCECCKQDEEDIPTKPTIPRPIGGYDNPAMYNVQEQIRPLPPPSTGRKKFFFSNIPKIGKAGEKSNLVMDSIPTPFGSTTSEVDKNEKTIKKTTTANAEDSFVSFAQSSSYQYQAYGDAAMGGQEDILY